MICSVVFTFIIVLHISSCYSHPSRFININVNTRKTINIVDKRYLSLALDDGIAKHRWEKFDFRSKKLHILCKALSPAIFRFGGNAADLLIFKNEYQEINKSDNFNFTGKDFTNLYTFTKSVGWRLMFDLNVRLRKKSEWDFSNTEKLLNYIISSNQYENIDFQLGNEPNSFNHQFNETLSAKQLAKDFTNLVKLLRSPRYDQYFNKSILVGPDTTQPWSEKIVNYIRIYLDNLKDPSNVLRALTFHQYYMNGRTATLNDFLNATIMDKIIGDIFNVKNLLKSLHIEHLLPVWLGETSSAYGGGAPNISDTFAAGFLWLDKLGIAAKYGVELIVRQAIYGSHYSLFDYNLDPLPDYWLSLIFKRLVGRKVLDIKTETPDSKLRIYTHCSNTKYVKKNSVTIFLQNMDEDIRHLKIKINHIEVNSTMLIYTLTSVGSKGLLSRQVALNGNLLYFQSKLPELLPIQVTGAVKIPPYSFNFIVVETKNLQDNVCCNDFHA